MDKKTKVLVVEDEPAIAQDIASCLNSLGYEAIGPVSSASKAIDLLKLAAPDIALLDISIQGEASGIDLAKQINLEFKIPFVYLTSYADKVTVEAARETFPYGYIVKPFKESDLAPAIEVALVRHEAKRGFSLPTRLEITDSLAVELSKMEYTILENLWTGKKNKEIAEVLFLSVNTIKSHCHSLFKKLQVGNRGEAINKIRRIKG